MLGQGIPAIPLPARSYEKTGLEQDRDSKTHSSDEREKERKEDRRKMKDIY